MVCSYDWGGLEFKAMHSPSACWTTNGAQVAIVVRLIAQERLERGERPVQH
jgi:hypothetical protein